MKKLLLIASLSMALPAMAQTVATVNGQSISQAELDFTIKAVGLQSVNDEQRKAILDEVINRDVLAQEAVKQGLDKQEIVKMNIESTRKEILIASLIQDWAEKNPVSDTDVKKAYDQSLTEFKQAKEYKVSHILVKEEDKAKQLIADIKDKKVSFEEAAKKDSLDPGSGRDGGDLGWSDPSAYVPEFADAVRQAKKGEITEPVKSQYGYHIILVTDERSVAPPSFDSSQAEIKQRLSREKLMDYVQTLRKDAKVEITEAK